jgi:hypothetical protein
VNLESTTHFFKGLAVLQGAIELGASEKELEEASEAKVSMA